MAPVGKKSQPSASYLNLNSMDAIIETPRLRLTRLIDTNLESQHLQWFHEYWSDEHATCWNIHGTCKTLEESQQWMIEQTSKYDTFFYVIHLRSPTDHKDSNPSTLELSDMVGSVSLKKEPSGPIMPPLRFNPASSAPETANKPINHRLLSYGIFKHATGRGYATEANSGLLAAYTQYRSQFPSELSYIEAEVGHENPDSIKVLRKLGFEQAGWKVLESEAFLAGKWREPGYWVYGKYV